MNFFYFCRPRPVSQLLLVFLFPSQSLFFDFPPGASFQYRISSHLRPTGLAEAQTDSCLHPLSCLFYPLSPLFFHPLRNITWDPQIIVSLNTCSFSLLLGSFLFSSQAPLRLTGHLFPPSVPFPVGSLFCHTIFAALRSSLSPHLSIRYNPVSSRFRFSPRVIRLRSVPPFPSKSFSRSAGTTRVRDARV